MKLQRGWRRSAVKPPSDSLELALERVIGELPQDTLVREMLCYHFGYSDTDGARRGKRARPRLLLCVAQEAGAQAEDAMDAAVAIELLHNYSLIHDDIEDGDRLRHGRETLWVKYGVAQAVNAGDALCALSFLSLLRAQARHPAARVTAMVARLHEAHLAMCHGQSLDMEFERREHVSSQRYLEMIAGKTAALFATACELGAMCAGLDESRCAAYRDLGAAFGAAFQMYDDLLGVWADLRVTGKTAGTDIARRKKSFPIVWALEGPLVRERELIARAYTSEGEMDALTIAGVIGALDALGAQEATRASAANHLAVVQRAPSGPVRDFLLYLLPVAASAEETLRS
ncbi:MAG: polyprenyl synthetase family protein [Vulcanimicrobiaceae bacterium]